MSAGGGLRAGQLVAEAATRLEALAGPAALSAMLEREATESPAATRRRKIAAGLADAEGREARQTTGRFLGEPVTADPMRLGATLVDADLGDQVAWRAVITPRDLDEAAEFSAAGALSYELYLLVGADGRLAEVHQRIDRSPHGRRWFTPAPAPRWLHPQGSTLDVAWSDVAAPARARMLSLLAALSRTAPATPAEGLAAPSLAAATRRPRRSRH